MIHQYIKNQSGQLIVGVVALDKNRVGWSKCMKSDVFNKDRALMIAVGRASINPIENADSTNNIPHSLKPFVVSMLERSQRYFKSYFKPQ
jgi:hypothetical protein